MDIKNLLKLISVMVLIIFSTCTNSTTDSKSDDTTTTPTPTTESTPPSIPKDGLIAEYLFNGNANDTSGNGLNGIVNGSVITSDRSGKTNSAYSFNGTNQYIQVNVNPKLSPANQITLAAWYKPTVSFGGGGNDPIIDKGYTSHVNPFYQYHMGVKGDNYPDKGLFAFSVTTINNPYVCLVTPSNFWQINKWYFIVGTYDGTNVKLYVNGNFITSQPATGTMVNYGKNVYIGKYGNIIPGPIQYHLPGNIDNIRIYDRALSDDEIKILYNYDNQ